jgi:beta-phosphoglucomutase-like phosphatase (HAD superfamily)
VTTATALRRRDTRRHGSTAVVHARQTAVPELNAIDVAADRKPVDLELLSAHWQRALDAAGRALRAAGGSLPATEVRERQVALVRETERTAATLRELGRGRQPAPWLSPTPVTNRMLGLPAGVRACLFDVEGVLTDSSRLHAWAWGEVFDDYLSRVAAKTQWQFVPFDRMSDYRTYVESRPRLEAVHAFLDSRGIRVREGHAGDGSDADTAYGLSKRKGNLLEIRLHDRGVTALPGARRYLEAARRAGLSLAVVYESASTAEILERAGLASLIDERVDAAVISAEALHSRPAPDLLLAACRRLGGVYPADAVAFTTTAAGVVAGLRAGILTIGVGDVGQLETLEGFGAQQVVPELGALLDPRLRAVLGE